jgi:hypothetical protein
MLIIQVNLPSIVQLEAEGNTRMGDYYATYPTATKCSDSRMTRRHLNTKIWHTVFSYVVPKTLCSRGMRIFTVSET